MLLILNEHKCKMNLREMNAVNTNKSHLKVNKI